MPITSTVDRRGVAEVIMEHPPVNALTVAGWFELARIVRGLGEDPAVRALVLRAEGRGFNAGVDIKEMQATDGFDALIGANRGCYAAFAAVYECAVPVVAAVHGYCLGGGIGLVGNADVIVASDDATFGLPGSTEARSAPRPTSPGWCRSTGCGRWCTRARPSPPASSSGTGRCFASCHATSCALLRSTSRT
jgi:enoyl-CoA hydratase/carnithine racemase